VLGAGVAVLSIEGLEAAAAIGPPVLHDVPLPPQHGLALEAAEVLHVPVPPFGLGAFIGKNDLGEENDDGAESVGGGTQDVVFVSLSLTQPLNFTAKPPASHPVKMQIGARTRKC